MTGINVKVFGGAGFVGNHLVKKLLSEGHNVTVFDLKKPRILGSGVSDPTGSGPSWYNAVKFIGGDITDDRQVYYAIDRGDHVVNLAAVAQFAQAEDQFHIAAAVNAVGTANVLKACMENKAAHLVYASTGSVYSKDAHIPIDEGQDIADPPRNSVYGMTKTWAEDLLYHYYNKMPLATLRFPHIVGPGKFWGANTIIAKLLANERPVIFGDGSARNEFTYVADVVQAVELAIKKQARGVYNIGTGKSRSTMDFFRLARMACDKMHIEPIFAPPRGVDFRVFEYDISKARKELGYNPQFSLEDAVQRTVLEWSQWL